MQGLQWERHNHFRWEEANGDSTFVQVEQETNPAVFATGDSQDLFFIIHRVTNFSDQPVSEEASIEGTFLTQLDSAQAARKLFGEDINGRDVEREEVVKPDGLLLCRAQSRGEGGYRWTVEVIKGAWAHM